MICFSFWFIACLSIYQWNKSHQSHGKDLQWDSLAPSLLHSTPTTEKWERFNTYYSKVGKKEIFMTCNKLASLEAMLISKSCPLSELLNLSFINCLAIIINQHMRELTIASVIWFQAEEKEVPTFLAAPRKVSGSLVTKLTIARIGRLMAVTITLKLQHSDALIWPTQYAACNKL